MKASIALLLSGLAAQQVTATWSRNAGKFNSPQYNNNECSDKQKGGFSWGDLPEGSFTNYGDFGFQGGWTCANSFGKRDSLTKRTFNSKCIKNSVSKDKPAAFDCSKRKDGFSVSEIQVSVEFDCDLEFHYKMPDASICKHVAPCKKEGSTVQNTQCGGAQSVEVYLGNHNQQGKTDCEIGFHHIGFDCNPGYTPSATPSPSQPPKTSVVKISSQVVESSTQPPVETPSSQVESSTQPPVETPSSQVESSTPPAETPIYSTAPGVYTNSSIPAYTPPAENPASSTSVDTPGYTPPAENPASSTSVDTPGYTAPGYTPPAENPASSTSVDTPGYTPPAENPASSTSVDTPGSTPPASTAPVDTPGYTPPASLAAPTPSASAPANYGYTPPDVLPKCMETWLEINTKCKDNTDSNCYCKNPDFTKNVIDCVAAWATDSQTQQSLQYLIGICAPYVPQNPGIITNCPSNIPLNPTAPPAASSVLASGTAAVETTAAPSGAPPAVPVTTITYQTTITVPYTTGGSVNSTVTTISTEVTVPQVVFTTQSPVAGQPGGTPTEPVALVPGTPAPVPAQTTAPYPIPTSLGTVTVPKASGSGVTSPPSQFTGAASSVNVGLKPALFGAALAFFAL